jgi:hypothetical protein
MPLKENPTYLPTVKNMSRVTANIQFFKDGLVYIIQQSIFINNATVSITSNISTVTLNNFTIYVLHLITMMNVSHAWGRNRILILLTFRINNKKDEVNRPKNKLGRQPTGPGKTLRFMMIASHTRLLKAI